MNVVILDTNIWVSALLFSPQHGTILKAFRRAVDEDILVLTDELEEELRRILTVKFRWPREHADKVLAEALRRSIRVKLYGTVRVCRDRKDNMFLECCERSGADYLVAGDKDLLVLGRFGRTRIVTAAEYLQTGRV